MVTTLSTSRDWIGKIGLPNAVGRCIAVGSYCLHMVGPLLISTYIYTCCRPAGVGVQQAWIWLLGHDGLVEFQSVYATTVTLSEWVVYSLPALLWTFSIGLMACFFDLDYKRRYYLLCLLPLALTLGLEALQYMQLTDGTFDTGDVWAGMLGYGGAILYIRTHPVVTIRLQDVHVRRLLFAVLFAFVYLGDVWVS